MGSGPATGGKEGTHRIAKKKAWQAQMMHCREGNGLSQVF